MLLHSTTKKDPFLNIMEPLLIFIGLYTIFLLYLLSPHLISHKKYALPFTLHAITKKHISQILHTKTNSCFFIIFLALSHSHSQHNEVHYLPRILVSLIHCTSIYLNSLTMLLHLSIPNRAGQYQQLILVVLFPK